MKTSGALPLALTALMLTGATPTASAAETSCTIVADGVEICLPLPPYGPCDEVLPELPGFWCTVKRNYGDLGASDIDCDREETFIDLAACKLEDLGP